MHGHLTATSLADVCRRLADELATGVLHVTGLEASGRLVFDQGRLVSASSPTPGSRLGDRLVHAGLLDERVLDEILREQAATPLDQRSRLGRLLVDRDLVADDAVRLVVQEQLLDAVFDLSDWRNGSFRFEPDAETDASEIPLAVPVDQALLEVARRREEWDALREVIPDLDAVPHFREGISTPDASLEPDEFAVMAGVDGQRTIRDLAYDLGYGEFEAARVVYGLSLLGLVEVRLPVHDIGAALDEALSYAGERGEAGTDEGQTDPAEPWPSWEADVAAAQAAEAEGDVGGGSDPGGGGPDPGGDEQVGAATPEAELPDFSGFEELRLADRNRDTGADSPGQAARGAQAGSGAGQAPPDGTEEPPADPSRGSPAPAQRPAKAEGDVSELLRELSRLALDDEEDEEPVESDEQDASDDSHARSPSRSSPPSRPPPARPSPREEPKRRKRGLFGFGG